MSNQISKQNQKKGEAGFTIVELLIATAVFSVVMLVCAMAIVHVGKMYYKGVITNRTQDAARQISDNIAASIQFGEIGTAFDGNYHLRTVNSVAHRTVCIGKTRYTYAPEAALGSGTGKSAHVLWRDRIVTDCYTTDNTSPDYIDLTRSNPGGSGGQELVGSNMRVPEITVTQPSGDTLLWDIAIRVAYGDVTDLFESGGGIVPFSTCRGVNASGQFCATSQLKTSVVKRL